MVIESTENIEDLTPNDRLIHDFIQLIGSKFEKVEQESNELHMTTGTFTETTPNQKNITEITTQKS